MIASAYDLPYSVYYGRPPLLEAGRDVLLTVAFHGDVAPDTQKDADSLVTTFFHLAGSGALGGGAIAPWGSRLAAVDLVSRSADSVTWRLGGAHVADTSIPILAQLFLLTHALQPLRQIVLRDQVDDGALVTLGRTNANQHLYPALYGPMASKVVLPQAFSDDVLVNVTFRTPPSERERAAIRLKVEDWIAASAIGSYPIAPQRPDFCGLEYDRTIDFFEDGMEIFFRNFYCHPESLFGLSNAMFATAPNAPAIDRIEFS